MTTTLATMPAEEATLVVTVAWLDDASAAVTPSAATWTLTDVDGRIVNSRDAVAITGLSTSNAIVLSGADLALSSTFNGPQRVLLVEYTYTSSAGSNLPGKAQCVFTIEDLVGESA
jgi:hypothetical protein